MTQPDAAPALAPSHTEAAPSTSPAAPRRGRPENLVRYPKGSQPEHLRAHQALPDRVKITRRSLLDDIRHVLGQNSGALQRKLALSIVKNAIDGNGACLAFIAERFAPVLRDEGQGRTVFEGIKLEVVGGAEGTRTTIALVRGSESHSDSAAQSVSDISSAEATESQVVIEGVPETPKCLPGNE